MKILLILLTILAVATASFDRCYPGALTIRDLAANPIDIVHSNQLTSFHIGFTVPNGTWIPDGMVEISSRWSFLPAYVQKLPLSTYMKLPLYAGDHDFDYKMPFPIGFWGRVVSDIKVWNATGQQLLCARWDVRVQ